MNHYAHAELQIKDKKTLEEILVAVLQAAMWFGADDNIMHGDWLHSTGTFHLYDYNINVNVTKVLGKKGNVYQIMLNVSHNEGVSLKKLLGFMVDEIKKVSEKILNEEIANEDKTTYKHTFKELVLLKSV